MNSSIFKKIVGSREIKNGSLLGFGHVLTLLLGLGSTIVWTRWMPIEMYGQFKVVIGVISFAGAFCSLGIGQIALMSASKGADGNLGPLIRKKFLANWFGSSVIMCVAAYYFFLREDSIELAYGLALAALIFPLYNIADLWPGWFNGKSRFLWLASGRSLNGGLLFFAVVVLALFDVSSIWLVISMIMLSISLLNIWLLNKALTLRQNSDYDSSLLKFGRHASIALMFSSILALDVVFLENFHTLEVVAVYSVSLVLPGLLKAVFGIVGQVAAPKIYSTDSPVELWKYFKKKFIWLTLGFTLLGTLGFLTIPFIVPLLFSEEYMVAGIYAKWLWLVICCSGSFSYLGLALLATKRPKYTYIPNVGAPAVTVLLWIALIEYGAAGMICARCVQAILLSMYYVIAFSNLLDAFRARS